MAYSPAGVLTTTGTLTHLVEKVYRRKALDNVLKKFVFQEACIVDNLENQNGKTVQWYRTDFNAIIVGADTPTPGAEGTVGTSLGMATDTVDATISQYFDYISFSDLLKFTDLTSTMERAADLLSYRAATIVDNITRLEVDSQAGAEHTLSGTYFTAADAAAVRHTLQGLDVRPMQSGPFKNYFFGVIHPYVSYDLVFDPSAGGYNDVMKRHDPTKFTEMDDRGQIATFGDVKFIENTNVTETAGDPNLWRTYIFGHGGLGCVSLAGRPVSHVMDPRKERFRLMMVQGGADKADPAGVIGGSVAYNFTYVAKTLDTSPFRFRWIDSPSSIVD